MSKYFRKVVELQPVYAEKYRQKKGQIAYYKFENRNKQYKIHLIINDVIPLDKENYVFCIVYKENEDLVIKEIRTLLVKQNNIDDKLVVEENLADKLIGTLIIIKNSQSSMSFTENIRWVGYHEKFDLSQLKSGKQKTEENINSINNKVEMDKTENQVEDKIIIESTEEINVELQKKIKLESVDEAKELLVKDKNKKAVEEKKEESLNKTKGELIEEKKFEGKKVEPVAKIKEDLIEQTKEEAENIEHPKVKEQSKEQLKKDSEVDSENWEKIYNDEGIQKSKDDVNETEKKTVNSQDFNQQGKKSFFESINSYKKNMEKERISDFINDLFRTNQQIIPFVKIEENVEWIQIDISDLIYLPIDSWIYINNAFLMNCYRKYEHLILGRNKVENLIMLGVPDVYYFKNGIIANLCGFYEFRSCKDTHPKAGEYGYWIVKSM